MSAEAKELITEARERKTGKVNNVKFTQEFANVFYLRRRIHESSSPYLTRDLFQPVTSATYKWRNIPI